MKHEYLIIEEQGEDLVVTGLKDNAPSDIVIPEGVTQIGNDAFMNRIGMTSIIIPDSVTEIGENAFANCTNLVNVSIPGHLTAGDLLRVFKGYESLDVTIWDDNNENSKI